MFPQNRHVYTASLCSAPDTCGPCTPGRRSLTGPTGPTGASGGVLSGLTTDEFLYASSSSTVASTPLITRAFDTTLAIGNADLSSATFIYGYLEIGSIESGTVIYNPDTGMLINTPTSYKTILANGVHDATNDYMVIFGTGSGDAHELIMPTDPAQGREIIVKNLVSSLGNVTVSSTDATFDGQTTLTVLPGQAYTFLYADAVNKQWAILSAYLPTP